MKKEKNDEEQHEKQHKEEQSVKEQHEEQQSVKKEQKEQKKEQKAEDYEIVLYKFDINNITSTSNKTEPWNNQVNVLKQLEWHTRLILAKQLYNTFNNQFNLHQCILALQSCQDHLLNSCVFLLTNDISDQKIINTFTLKDRIILHKIKNIAETSLALANITINDTNDYDDELLSSILSKHSSDELLFTKELN